MLCGIKPHDILRRRSDSAPEIAQVADTFFCVEKLAKQSAQLSHFASHRLGRRTAAAVFRAIPMQPLVRLFVVHALSSYRSDS